MVFFEIIHKMFKEKTTLNVYNQGQSKPFILLKKSEETKPGKIDFPESILSVSTHSNPL